MAVLRTLGWLLLAAILGLAALAGLGWVLGLVVTWISAQDSEIAAASIAFLGTVTAGIGAVIVSQQRTKAREIAEAHRPLKTELYMSFISETVAVMRRAKAGTNPKADRKLEEFFYDFTTKVMLWGSPAVLQAYSAFRTAGENPQIVYLVDDVIQAMRKDLGLSNWGLQRGDLIKTLLTDPEKLDEVLKAG